MSLSSISIKKPITTLMIFAALCLIGGISLRQLAIDLLPDITFPMVAVLTEYQGAGPEEVEAIITVPLESVVSTVNNIDEVSSLSYDGGSAVMVAFDWGADIEAAANEVREKVALVESYFPDGVQKPLIFKFDPSLMPIMLISISGNLDPAKLRELADEKVKYRLERMQGVAAVDILGGKEREIHVEADASKLASVGISLSQLISVLRAENINLPGGFLETGRQEYLIRTAGTFKSVEEIGQVVVALRGDTPVYLEDVARVSDSYKEIRATTRVNGEDAVVLMIRKRSGTNTVQVAQRVKEEMERLTVNLPAETRMVVVMDSSRFIQDAITQLEQVAIFGAIVAFLVVFLFMFNIRSTLIAFFSIPLSMLIAFIFLNFAGLTLNMMTLGGLALGVGMMVDSSIVVLENIFRHRQEGKSPREAAIIGSSEVGMAIIASILTTVVVFLSLLFVTGMIGIFFKNLAYTVAFSLFASLIVSLTAVPALCSRYLHISPPKRDSGSPTWAQRILSYLELRYAKVLDWALGHRKTVIGISAALFVISLLFVSRIGQEFLPSVDQGEISVDVKMPLGTSLPVTDKVTKEIEEIVMGQTPDLDNLYASSGGGEMMGFGGGGSHTAQLRIQLVNTGDRESSPVVTERLRKAFAHLPAREIKVTEAGMMGGGPGAFGGRPIVIEITGYDLDESSRIAQQIVKILRETEGVVEPEVSYEEGEPEIRIIIDRKKASSLGLNLAQIARTVETANAGRTATRFREAGNEYDIRVRLRSTDRRNLSDLEEISLITPWGETIPLRAVARLERTVGPVNISRKEQERIITVSAGVTGRDLGSIDRELRSKITQLDLPEDLSITFGGEQKEMAESFQKLLLALILAVVLVYMVMASQFESLRHPFVIMVSIPLALIGVILMLLLSQESLNIVVFMGLIMLAGIVVNNGIVMISYINILRSKGMSLGEAVRTGAQRRLRPILMTTLTTVFALVPMALGFGAGATLWAPMARTVIGGLSISTVFTLILMPTLYTLLSGKK